MDKKFETKSLIRNDIGKMEEILEVINYTKTFINIPYRWWHEKEEIQGNDKFWAENGKPISSQQIKKEDKCIVCTGLINLVRRYLNLSIPGLDGKQGKLGLKYPGTTYTWFRYLKRKKRLEEINFRKKYPIGTLLIANYINVNEQGHVAIITDSSGRNVKKQNIIHSFSDYSYEESKNMKKLAKQVFKH